MPTLTERKIKPTCGNCLFSYSLSNDPEETEKCKLVGKLNSAKINLLALEYLLATDVENMCEYHRAVERLKDKIDYSTIK